MSENKIKDKPSGLILELMSYGVDINGENLEKIESILIRKSLKRYTDLATRYKNLNKVNKVPWNTINEIYKNDIKLRRVINHLTSALEISLRSHISNVLRKEKITIFKNDNSFSKKYFIDDSVKFKNYNKAKQSFRWKKTQKC